MIGGVILAVRPTRAVPDAAPHTAGARPEAKSSASFMDRMNDRWDRRRGDG
jgi:hypothetical protein